MNRGARCNTLSAAQRLANYRARIDAHVGCESPEYIERVALAMRRRPAILARLRHPISRFRALVPLSRDERYAAAECADGAPEPINFAARRGE